MSEKRFPVAEIFGPTLQGEGSQVGRKTHFIRFGYCDGAGGKAGWCTWCDSLFAVDPKNKSQWKMMTHAEIVEAVIALPKAEWITFSGGNPALHDLTSLVKSLQFGGWKINVETQGTLYPDWLDHVDHLTISPKPSSARNGVVITESDWAMYDEILAQPAGVTIKVVVKDSVDYEFAKEVHRRYPYHDFYLSVWTSPDDVTMDILDRYDDLTRKVLADETIGDVAVLPQLHVVMWGHKRGV
jgi:7-carboxy-7-deazaguanine synthase